MCKVTDTRKISKRRKYILGLKKRKYKHDKEEKLKKQKLACNCFKQETQNYQVYEEKKSRASKRFENCKKRVAALKLEYAKSKKKNCSNKNLLERKKMC